MPSPLRADCVAPTVDSLGNGRDVRKAMAFGIQDDAARLCEKGRKEEAVGIIDKVNAAVDKLKGDLTKAILDSRIKTGPFGWW